MTQVTRDIAIVGGGLSGLCLALALHSHGITCTIYELRDSSFTEGGGLSLTPNALQVLDLLGVYVHIKDKGYQFDKVQIKTETNVKITEYFLGSKKLFGYDALRINRQILLAALRKTVQDKGITIKYGRKFFRVIAEDDEGVSFEFEDGSSESASLLIGADGIHSQVRRSIHPEASPTYTGIMALISTVDRSALHFPSDGPADNYLPCFVAGQLGAFVMIPQSPDGNKITAFSHTRYPETDKAGWNALRSDPEKLLAMQTANKNEWPDYIQSVMESIEHGTTTAWPYSFMPDLGTWTSPRKRVVLLGDAAHAIPPASGQGAAQAFEDAYSLGLVLSKLSPQVKFEAGVTWWQKYRMERTKTILEVTKIMTERRAPKPKHAITEEEFEERIQNRGLELQRWLYRPIIEEEVFAWVKLQQGK